MNALTQLFNWLIAYSPHKKVMQCNVMSTFESTVYLVGLCWKYSDPHAAAIMNDHGLNCIAKLSWRILATHSIFLSLFAENSPNRLWYYHSIATERINSAMIYHFKLLKTVTKATIYHLGIQANLAIFYSLERFWLSTVICLDTSTTMLQKISDPRLWIWPLCLVSISLARRVPLITLDYSMHSGYYISPINRCKKKHVIATKAKLRSLKWMIR